MAGSSNCNLSTDRSIDLKTNRTDRSIDSKQVNSIACPVPRVAMGRKPRLLISGLVDVEDASRKLKRGDPDRKKNILELSSQGHGATAIARILSGSETSVRKVIKKDAESRKNPAQAVRSNPWYQSIDADKKLAECLAAARTESPHWTTDLADGVVVRDITKKELERHTFPHTISKRETENEKDRKRKAGKVWMQARLTGPPRPDDHGFVIFPSSNTDEDCELVSEKLPKLLDETNYNKTFLPIFQTVQGRATGKSSMGDNKRKQAKMSALLAKAEQRVQEASTAFNRFAPHTRTREKDVALKTLRATEAEKALVNEEIDHMCEIYNQIQEVSQNLLWYVWFYFVYQTEKKFDALKVWPSAHNTPKRLSDSEALACLESLPGAKSQGFHRDSRKPGFTGIKSFEQDQYIYVLFFSFFAMRVLEELRKDRVAATEYVRSRLAEHPENSGIVLSDSDWKDVEPRIWQFLVHEEFRVRKVRPFEVVRVPVRKNHTAGLDTRCPHGGAPWTGKRRAYRGHFYGYERDLQKQTPEERMDKDEYATVDLCDNDFSPIVGWAQLNNIFSTAEPKQPKRRRLGSSGLVG